MNRIVITDQMKENFHRDAFLHVKEQLFEKSDYLNLKNYLFSYVNSVPERLRPTFFTSNPYIKTAAYSDWVASPPLLNLLPQLLGPDLYYVNFSICYKPPNSVYRVGRHIDSQYLVDGKRADPQAFYNVFIPFSKCTKQSGCLRVLPGVNEDKFYKHKPTNKEFNFFVNEIDDPEIDDSKMVDVEMEENEVCLMKNSVVHESGANSTSEPRLAIVLRYATAHSKIQLDEITGPRRLHLIHGENVANNPIEDLEGREKIGNFSWS